MICFRIFVSTANTSTLKSYAWDSPVQTRSNSFKDRVCTHSNPFQNATFSCTRTRARSSAFNMISKNVQHAFGNAANGVFFISKKKQRCTLRTPIFAFLGIAFKICVCTRNLAFTVKSQGPDNPTFFQKFQTRVDAARVVRENVVCERILCESVVREKNLCESVVRKSVCERAVHERVVQKMSVKKVCERVACERIVCDRIVCVCVKSAIARGTILFTN